VSVRQPSETVLGRPGAREEEEVKLVLGVGKKASNLLCIDERRRTADLST